MPPGAGSWWGERSPWVRGAAALLAFAVLDLAAPLAGYLAAVRRLYAPLLARASEAVNAGYLEGVPSDYQGTAWFYWWFAEARRRGVDVLTPDVVCVPGGQALGQNFPQQLDAWAASFFFDAYPFPLSYNLFQLGVPVLGALAAYLALRSGARSRLLCWSGGLLFGFNAYSTQQLVMGRPTIALLVTVPLFVAAWLRATDRAGAEGWAWAAAAGAAAALAVQHYVVYAGLLALFGAAALVARLLWPEPGVRRRRLLAVVLVTGALAVVGSASYVHELLQRRPVTSGQEVGAVQRRPAWDPQLWAELGQALHGEDAPTSRFHLRLAEPGVRRVHERSLPVGYLAGQVEAVGELPRVALPRALLIAVLVLVPFGRRRALGWLGLVAGAYVLTLGPAAASAIEGGIELARPGGRTWLMPTWWVLSEWPVALQFWHPVRAFPLVLMGLVGALVAGGAALGEVLGRRSEASLGRSWPGRWLVGPLALGVALYGTLQVEAVEGFELVPQTWEPHPYLVDLGERDPGEALVELPVGMGHGLALNQLVHRQPRADGHHDEVGRLTRGEGPPEDCFRLALLEAMWWAPRTGPEADAAWAAGTTPEEIQAARQAGFRQVVVYRGAFDYVDPGEAKRWHARATSRLRRVLGPPAVSEGDLRVFSLVGEPLEDPEP